MTHLNDLTIIIVTYKTNKEILFNCIDTIDSSIKILIIENSSDNDFKNELEKKYSNISVILADKNLGYGAGNNLGFKNMKTRYGLVSNPDVIYKDDFFIQLKNYLKPNFEFSIIGPSYYNDTPYWPYGAFDNRNDSYMRNKNYNENYLKEVDWVVGCSILFDTNNIDKNDMFDENIFLYFEEVDLCKRIKSKKGKIYNSSILKIEHLGRKGSATDPQYLIETEVFRNWHWMWSSFYYYKKHNNYFYALLKMSGKFIESVLKIIIYSIFYNKAKQNAYFARLYGLICSFIGIKSFYRVKSLFK